MTPDEGKLGRDRLTLSRRVELLERDRAQHARSLTELVSQVQNGFSTEQMEQIRSAMSEVLADAGLRIDEPKGQDEAREDFRFLRRLRRGLDGLAGKIGWVIIAAVLGGVIYIVNLGLNAWRGGA